MPVIPVRDIEDPRLDSFRSLKHTNSTRYQNQFIAEGDKVTRRLLASRFPVVSLVAAETCAAQFAALAPPETPVYSVSQASLKALVGFNFHRGVLACGARLPPPTWQELLTGAGQRITLVACGEVQQPENLAGILRSSLAFGVKGVITGPGSADPFSRRVLRVSMGASLFMPVVESTNLGDELQRLYAQHGFEIVATVLSERAENLDDFAVPLRTVLLLGSEGHGLSPELERLANRRVTIPMRAGADSLNVSVAAGVFLYHFTRQQ